VIGPNTTFESVAQEARRTAGESLTSHSLPTMSDTNEIEADAIDPAVLRGLYSPAFTARCLNRSASAIDYFIRRGRLTPLRLANGTRLFKPGEVRRLARELEAKDR
jgi:hypothetical protein